MASNWGNKESLEEARHFLNEVSGKGGSRGRQGQGGGVSTSRASNASVHGNNSSNGSPHVGQKSAAQGAWGGFSGTTSTVKSRFPLATAPPAHPFFNTRAGSSKNNGAVGANTRTSSLATATPASPSKDGSGLHNQNDANGHDNHQQSQVDDVMDIDELPQAPGSGLTASRWGPAPTASATQTVALAPRLPATNTHRTSDIMKSQLGHGTARPPSPKLGMGASMWASTPVTYNKPKDDNPPAASTKPIIDNDWQTTYLMEDNERIYKVAADNASIVGDTVAEQQLRKVEGLFHDIVKARLDQDEARERAIRAEVQIAIKLAASALDKYKKSKPAQQVHSIGRAPDASATVQHNKPPLQPQVGQWSDQSSTLPSQPLQQKQTPQDELPRSPSTRKDAPPRGSLPGLGGKACFDDPEALRLWSDFLKQRK